MARNMHKYEDLTPFEFEQEKERASIVYVSAGPLEYHEECNILGADTNKGYDWCLAAAEITGGIVFPMLPVAPAFGGGNYMTQEKLRSQYKLPHHRDEYADNFGSLYPSIFFSSEVCKMMYKELLDMLADEIGFKLCVFVGSHGPAAWMIKDIVIEESNGMIKPYKERYEKINGEYHGMRVMAVGSTDYNRDLIMDYYKEIADGDPLPWCSLHGGVWEAALNYAIDPEYFHPEYLDETKYPQHYGALREHYEEKTYRPCKREFRKLTPEFAKKMRDTTVSRLSEEVLKQYNEIIKK